MVKFKCKERCGDCCCEIPMTPELIKKHKDKIQVPILKETEVQHFPQASEVILNTKDKMCVFLNRKTRRCEIYEDRPKLCRDYGQENGGVSKCPYFDSEGNPKELRLDLACGDNRALGFVGVDMVKTAAADIVWDLNVYPWPWKDGEVEEITCRHFVEHVEDLMKFMNECYRILKVNGKMNIVTPYYNSVRAWQDPTHVRVISEMTFLYYNKGWREVNHLEHYPITCDFDFQYNFGLVGDWNLRSEEARQFAMQHYSNVIQDIYVTLVKRKPELLK
jgi:Fe-S-cluster containining protein